MHDAPKERGEKPRQGSTKRIAFWTAKGGPQGERSESSPLSPPYSEEKAWIRVQAFLLSATGLTPGLVSPPRLTGPRFAAVSSNLNTA